MPVKIFESNFKFRKYFICHFFPLYYFLHINICIEIVINSNHTFCRSQNHWNSHFFFWRHFFSELLESSVYIISGRVCHSHSERFSTGLCRIPRDASRDSRKWTNPLHHVNSTLLFHLVTTSMFNFNGFWLDLSCPCIAISFLVAIGLLWKCSAMTFIFFISSPSPQSWSPA